MSLTLFRLFLTQQPSCLEHKQILPFNGFPCTQRTSPSMSSSLSAYYSLRYGAVYLFMLFIVISLSRMETP